VFGYHLFNFGVHIVSAILVWWLTRLTLSTPAMKEDRIAPFADLIALFAGLVFVSHPIQTQAVTYIVQRAASMATLFYLASLCLYIKSRSPLQPPGLRRFYYCFSLAAAIMAMFTKEMTITLPLMILFYEFSFFRTKKGINWRPLIPYLPILLIIPYTMFITKSVDFYEMRRVAEGPAGISPAHYLLTQFRVMVTYIRLVFVPLNQNLDYDYPVFKNIFEFPVLASLIFLTSILFCAKQLFSKYRIVSFSIFWFFLTLLPESSIIPIKDVIFEHRLYLPLAGYSIFLASSAYYLLGKNSFKATAIALTMIIAFYSVLTYQRNKVWKDEIILWNDTLQKSPNKARSHNNRGIIYYIQGNWAQAVYNYKQALKINPYFADPYFNLGVAYEKHGKLTLAVREYNKALEINPRYTAAYYNRANIYYKQGEYVQAISDYNKAIKLEPNDPDFSNNSAMAYRQLNKILGKN
jgi:tetratricopeptide (TPR) repeat protein